MEGYKEAMDSFKGTKLSKRNSSTGTRPSPSTAPPSGKSLSLEEMAVLSGDGTMGSKFMSDGHMLDDRQFMKDLRVDTDAWEEERSKRSSIESQGPE